jgi:hypothetical protein
MTTPATSKKLFGAGRVFGALNSAAVPTPIRMGIPQDVSLTFKRGVKSLSGEDQLPAAIASGEMDVSGKVTMGTTNARLMAELLFNGSTAVGRNKEADNEVGTIPGTSTYTVTVTNSANYVADLGVLNTTTGNRMARVASGPAVGEYSVSAGVYTFSATDHGAGVKISYIYSDSGTGETVSLTNVKQGNVGGFTSNIVLPWQDWSGVEEQDIITLNWCLATDHEISTKTGDFGKPTLGFMAGCDNSGVLGNAYFAYPT